MQLRDVQQEDLPVLFEHQQDPDATKVAAFPPRDRAEFMKHWNTKVLNDPSVMKKAVVVGADVAGYVVSYDRDGNRLIGYWIGKEYWGKGIATGALAEFLTQEAKRPVFAIVAEHNVGSIRVLEKCGFAIDGASPEASALLGEDEEGFLFRRND